MLEHIKKNLSKLILCGIQLIVAILLLINPEGFTTGIVIVAGIMISLLGVGNIFKYIKLPAAAAAQQFLLARGILLLIVGLFLTIRNDWLLQFFPLLAVLYGVGLLITSVARLQWTVDMLRANRNDWLIMGISAAVTLILSLFILYHPVFIQDLLWTFVAVSLMVGAIFDAVNLILHIRKTA